MFASLNAHNKCPANSFCNFCLFRSVIFKINLPNGRQSIKPPEVECQLFKADEMTYTDILKVILDNASQSYPSFSSIVKPKWSCSCCSDVEEHSNESIIILDSEDHNRKINHLVEAKYNSIKKEPLEEALKHDNSFRIIFGYF